MADLIRKFYEAKKIIFYKVNYWGSGKPLKEFLYVEDFAEACLFALENWFPNNSYAPKDNIGESLSLLNIERDFEISISELSYKISKIIGFKGEIVWDESKPDGTLRKKLYTSHINNMDWAPKTNLDLGFKKL